MWEMTLASLNEIMGYWWLIPFGVGLGIFVGAVPGFSSTNVLIILLPFTLGMESGAGMAFMASLYSGSHMGGSIPAVLFNVPGTGSAAATCFDGYPMTQQGRGQEALAIAFVASAIGGLFTTLITLGALPYLSKMVYYFGASRFRHHPLRCRPHRPDHRRKRSEGPDRRDVRPASRRHRL